MKMMLYVLNILQALDPFKQLLVTDEPRVSYEKLAAAPSSQCSDTCFLVTDFIILSAFKLQNLALCTGAGSLFVEHSFSEGKQRVTGKMAIED